MFDIYREDIDKIYIIILVITLYIENIKIVYESFMKILLRIQFI